MSLVIIHATRPSHQFQAPLKSSEDVTVEGQGLKILRLILLFLLPPRTHKCGNIQSLVRVPSLRLYQCCMLLLRVRTLQHRHCHHHAKARENTTLMVITVKDLLMHTSRQRVPLHHTSQPRQQHHRAQM